MPAARRRLGDPGPHEPGPDDADGLDRGGRRARQGVEGYAALRVDDDGVELDQLEPLGEQQVADPGGERRQGGDVEPRNPVVVHPQGCVALDALAR